MIVLFILILLILWVWYDGRGGVVYIKNFLPLGEFEMVRDACRGVESQMSKDELGIVRNRYKYVFGGGDYVSRVFSSDNVRARLPGSPSDTPVEYRIYGKGGMMDWHRDVKLYKDPQYEMVYTVENTSDSMTQWVDPRTNRVHSITTEPNSVLMVRAEGVLHRVTPLNHGVRKIVKFAFV